MDNGFKIERDRLGYRGGAPARVAVSRRASCRAIGRILTCPRPPRRKRRLESSEYELLESDSKRAELDRKLKKSKKKHRALAQSAAERAEADRLERTRLAAELDALGDRYNRGRDLLRICEGALETLTAENKAQAEKVTWLTNRVHEVSASAATLKARFAKSAADHLKALDALIGKEMRITALDAELRVSREKQRQLEAQLRGAKRAMAQAVGPDTVVICPPPPIVR